MNDIEYNSVCSAGRRIYFGGHGGFIAFDPQEIKVDVRRYPVRLTSFRLHNTPVLPGAEIDGKVILENSVTFSDQIRLGHYETSAASTSRCSTSRQAQEIHTPTSSTDTTRSGSRPTANTATPPIRTFRRGVTPSA